MFKQMGFAALILSAALPAIAADTGAEIVFWQSIKPDSAADYRAYLKQFPQGQFAELAKSRLAGMGAKAPAAPKAANAKAAGGKAAKMAASRDGQPNPSGEAEPVPDPSDAGWVKVDGRDCFVRSPASAVPVVAAKSAGWRSMPQSRM
jgi:hypothetical protein